VISLEFYLAAIILLLFQKDLAQAGITEQLAEPDNEENEFSRIRCPLCRWQPTASSRWVCGAGGKMEGPFQGCGTSWNTFTTRGVCPGCAHQWRHTACLRCHRWSLHEDWYGGGED
jgi:hypothetical protein